MVCLQFSMRSLARLFQIVFSFVIKAWFHISYQDKPYWHSFSFSGNEFPQIKTTTQTFWK